MVLPQVYEGIGARRNGINGGSGKEARLEGGNRLCRSSLQAYSRHKPTFVPMISQKKGNAIGSVRIKNVEKYVLLDCPDYSS